jgi:hypothetical protein
MESLDSLAAVIGCVVGSVVGGVFLPLALEIPVSVGLLFSVVSVVLLAHIQWTELRGERP